MIVLSLSLAATAELGGTESSVQADQQRLRGTRRVTQAQAYAMHEIRTPANGVIHEFVAPDGKVFAVTYRGQFPGESNGLLGSHSAQLMQAMKSAPGPRRIGGEIHLQMPGLTYHAVGHLRYYSMRAYLPESIPQGVALEEVR